MKILMFMRDPAPPARADVRVLFDAELRDHDIDTDFVGPPPRHGAGAGAPVRGRLFMSRPSRARALELLRFAWTCLGIAWRETRHYDLVIVRDLPILAAPIFVLAALRAPAARAYWMSFPMPLGDRLLARDHARGGRYARAVVAWWRGVIAAGLLRGAALPLAQRVFVQSAAMRAAEIRAGTAEHKLHAVPMGVDTRLLDGLAPDAQLRTLAPGPWIVYLGSHNRARQLERLLEAMPAVLAEFPQARLAMVGRADTPADAQWLEQRARRICPHGEIVFFGERPMREAWRLIAGAALGVSPVPPGPLHDVSSPTKAVEYLALGLPVVGNAIPDQRHVIEQSGGGLVCEFSAPALSQAIRRLLRDPAHARAAGARGRAWVLRERSYARLAAELAPRLHALTAPHPRAARAD